jgi:hypothetical protein
MTSTTSSSPYRYITVDVVITQKPHTEASIYRTKVIQQEVVTSGVILFDKSKGGVHYPIRFVHDRTLSAASTLRSGNKIHVEMGRFDTRPGRKETELIVKDFSLIE